MYKFITDRYKWIFFRIYSWNLQLWGEKNLPKYNAAIWLSLILFINFLSVYQLVEIIFLSRFSDYGYGKAISFLLILVSISFHYFFLVRPTVFQDLKSGVESNFNDYERSRLICGFYNVGSIAIFFALVALRKYLQLIS